MILAAAGITAALITRGGSGGGVPVVATSHLEVIAVTPVNKPPQLKQSPGSVQASYDARTTAGLVITLRNPGNGVSVINRARIAVEHDAVFTEEGCIPGAGPIPISEHYVAELPANAGEAINVPLSQQVPANSADRFAIAFRPRPGYLDSNGTGAARLYVIHIQLYHDASPAPVDAGRVLLGVPFPAFFFLVRFKSTAPGALSSACVPHNVGIMRAALALPYSRSPELQAFASNPCARQRELAASWECP